jgi:hypothetical protein
MTSRLYMKVVLILQYIAMLLSYAQLFSAMLSYAQLCSATAQTALCLLIALVLLLHFHPQENKYSICEATWF